MGDEEEVSDFMKKIPILGKYSWFDFHFGRKIFNWSNESRQISGDICYLKANKQGNFPLDSFSQMIADQVFAFCLTRKELKEFRAEMESENFAAVNSFYQKAIGRLKPVCVNKDGQYITGECGEMLLFVLLEHLLEAPRLVCKMSLKTNSSMPVHGSDAIHIKHDSSDNSIVLFWGEAKLYSSDLHNTLYNITKSVNDFVSFPKNKQQYQREFEIDLINQHMDLSKFDSDGKNLIIDYLNPYNEKYVKRKEVHACLAVWSDDLYNKLDKDKFSIDSACSELEERAKKSFLSKIIDAPLNGVHFHLFLLPFQNVNEFRKLFCYRLGINYTNDI